jgi:hypothetical protein
MFNVKLAIKTSLAALISLYICKEVDHYIKRPDALVSGLWCVVASVFASQPTLGGTYTAIWNRFLGVLIGSLIGGFFAYFLGADALFLALAIFTTVIFCNLLGLKESYRIASLSAIVIIIPWGLNPSISPWIYAFFRFLDTCLGLSVAIFVAQVLWPSQALTKMRFHMVDIVSLIRQFYEQALISAGSLHKNEKVLQGLAVEINQALSKNQLLLEESKVEFIFLFSSITSWVELDNSLIRLWGEVKGLKDVFNTNVEEMFDESLKKNILYVSENITFILKALAAKLKEEKAFFDFAVIFDLQQILDQELSRFRLTRTTKKYNLETVENYFVFSYSLRNILKELNSLDTFIDQLKKLSPSQLDY